MTTPQPGIFQEGTQFHWFLHFGVRPDAPADHVRAAIPAVQDVAAAGSPPETVTPVVGFGRSMLQRLAPSEVRRAFAPFGELARETPSFVYRDSRDLTGFIDGTENPDAGEEIDRMLANMYGASPDGGHDRVVEFSQTGSGAYYFAPPAETLARILDIAP